MLTESRFCSAWSLAQLFDWGQWCPICRGTAFSYIEGGGAIHCDNCNAKFTLHMTGGDDGVVISCDADPNGRYVNITGGRTSEYSIHVGNPWHFWQVLKTCEGGLLDRETWCCELQGYDLYYERQDPPAFVETYCFDYLAVTTFLLQERFDKTPTGQRLVAAYEAACAAVRDPEQPHTPRYWYFVERTPENCEAFKAYEEADRALTLARYAYADWRPRQGEPTRKDLLHRELEQRGPYHGIYFAEQCERIWREDGMCMHRCLPKPGEQPRVKWPLYKRPERG